MPRLQRSHQDWRKERNSKHHHIVKSQTSLRESLIKEGYQERVYIAETNGTYLEGRLATSDDLPPQQESAEVWLIAGWLWDNRSG